MECSRSLIHILGYLKPLLTALSVLLLAGISNGLPLVAKTSESGFFPTSIASRQSDCTTHNAIITDLIKFNAWAFLAVLVGGNRRLLNCWLCRKHPPNYKETVDWSFLGLLGKLGSEIGKTYGLAVLTRAPGSDPQIWKFFQLWAIRPRATPFIAILGYSRGWTGAGFNSFIVDSILCLIAAQFMGTASMVSGDFEADKGSWPIYRIGAMISLVPLIFFILVGFAMLVFVGGCACCAISVYTCLACCKLCGHGGRNEQDGGAMEWKSSNYGWYTGYIVIFIIMYVGRWMMWSGMPLELWCPVMGNRVGVMMGLSPFAVQLIVLLLDTFSEWVGG